MNRQIKWRIKNLAQKRAEEVTRTKTHAQVNIGLLEILKQYVSLVNYRVSQKKNARRLIQCKLKTTVFTRYAFIFAESPYFNLKFGIKLFKIGERFAEQWLAKA